MGRNGMPENLAIVSIHRMQSDMDLDRLTELRNHHPSQRVRDMAWQQAQRITMATYLAARSAGITR